MAEDAPDVGEEADIQHPVGLVEDEDLQPAQGRIAVAEVVEEAAGCRHQDVDAAAQGALLRPHPDAAEDRGSRHPGVGGKAFEVLVDLGGQLPGRREDEDAGRPPRLGDEPMKNREEERGGLAAAGHGPREHVAAVHHGRDGLLLDGRRLGEAEIAHAAQEVGMETKRFE